MPLYLVTKEYADEHTLMHYRTIGSKNGVRRYQYEDGSLTPEGYIHYGIGKGNTADKAWNKARNKADAYEAKAGKYKSKAVWQKNMHGGFGTERLNKKAEKIQRRADEQNRLAKAINDAELSYNKKETAELREKAKQAAAKEISKYRDAIWKYEKSDDLRLPRDHPYEHEDVRIIASEIAALKGGGSRFIEGSKSYDEKKAMDRKLNRFDKLSDDEKQKVGREMLERMIEDKVKTEDYKPEELTESDRYSLPQIKQEYRQYAQWIRDRFWEKSGNLISDIFKPGSHSKEAYEQYSDVRERLRFREDDIRYQLNRLRRYNSDAQKKAYSSDDEWQSLSRQLEKAEDELIKAHLLDAGLPADVRYYKIVYPIIFNEDL